MANDDTTNTPEDTSVTIPILGNDKDVDGDVLSIVGTTNPSHGTIVVNTDGTITYTPDANYNGSDSFTYTISDGNGGTSTATVTLTVNSVNDVPVARDDTASVNEDGSLNGNVAGNDSPSGDGGNVWTVVSGPVHGSVTMNLDGTYTYTPDANYNGPDQFTYQIKDADGDISTATLSINVSPVNDPPIAVDHNVTVSKNGAVDIPVLDGCLDLDTGDILSVYDVSNPAHGTVIINADGTVTYTPNSGYSGLDSFTYTISDGNGGFDTAIVNITVLNHAPIIVIDGSSTLNITQNVTSISVIPKDIDGIQDIMEVKFDVIDSKGNIVASFTDTDGSNGWKYDFSPINFPSGNYTVRATATDLGGLSNSTEMQVKLFADLYIKIEFTKTHLNTGETTVAKIKVGDYGPCKGTDVVMTYVIPEGLDFVDATVDQGKWSYNATSRTITWNIGDVLVGDPYMNVTLRALKVGSYNNIFTINSTSTLEIIFSNNVDSGILHVTAPISKNAQAVKTNARTIPMQHTGLPLVGLILAVLAVFGGLVMPKRKN